MLSVWYKRKTISPSIEFQHATPDSSMIRPDHYVNDILKFHHHTYRCGIFPVPHQPSHMGVPWVAPMVLMDCRAALPAPEAMGTNPAKLPGGSGYTIERDWSAGFMVVFTTVHGDGPTMRSWAGHKS